MIIIRVDTFFPLHVSEALSSVNPPHVYSDYPGYIECNNPDYLKFTMSLKGGKICSSREDGPIKAGDLYGSVEF